MRQLYEVGTIIKILYREGLKLREVKSSVQGHTAENMVELRLKPRSV